MSLLTHFVAARVKFDKRPAGVGLVEAGTSRFVRAVLANTTCSDTHYISLGREEQPIESESHSIGWVPSPVSRATGLQGKYPGLLLVVKDTLWIVWAVNPQTAYKPLKYADIQNNVETKVAVHDALQSDLRLFVAEGYDYVCLRAEEGSTRLKPVAPFYAPAVGVKADKSGGKSIVRFNPETDYATSPDNSPIKPLLNSEQLSQPEGNIMNRIFTLNKNAAVAAATMEAGKLSNTALSKIVAKRAPLMIRGYVDTSAGRLVLANAAHLAVQQFRPDDKRLTALADAMVTAAYIEALGELNLDGILQSFLEDGDVKAALARLGDTEATASKKGE